MVLAHSSYNETGGVNGKSKSDGSMNGELG